MILTAFPCEDFESWIAQRILHVFPDSSVLQKILDRGPEAFIASIILSYDEWVREYSEKRAAEVEAKVYVFIAPLPEVALRNIFNILSNILSKRAEETVIQA